MENPIAQVSEYKKLLKDVIEVLVGLSVDNIDRGAKRRSQYYRKGKRPGIFGFPMCLYGVIEDHAKGTLHTHLSIWGGILPWILQRYATVEEVCKAISEVLESQYSSTLPDSTVVEQVVRDALLERRCSDIVQPKKTPMCIDAIMWCQECGSVRDGTGVPMDILRESLIQHNTP